MEPFKVKVLGISGTPIKDGNCDKLVQVALESAATIEGVETEFITLADKNIAPCKHCQYCVNNRARCNIPDDLGWVQDKIFEADGLILAAPTYNRVISTQLINVFTRGREEMFFSHRMVNKGAVASGVTLGWFGYGDEFALSIIGQLATSWQIIYLDGSSAVTSSAWRGLRADYQPNGVLDDQRGMWSVKLSGIRTAKVAKMMVYARNAGLNPSIYEKPKKEKVLVDGVWRDA